MFFYSFLSQVWSYWTNDPRISGESSFEKEFKVKASLFRQKLSNHNFEIVILFSIAKRYNNDVVGHNMTLPKPLEEGPYVTKFAHCLHIVFVIDKPTDIFQGNGDFLGMDFLREEFSIGMEVSRFEISRGSFTRGNLPEFVLEIYFIYLTFSLATPFYIGDALETLPGGEILSRVRIFWGIFTGKISQGEILHEKISIWEGGRVGLWEMG